MKKTGIFHRKQYIFLEAVLKEMYPNEPLWEYGIGLKVDSQTECAIWVEVHPAHTSNVGEMIRKAQWLRVWLKRSDPRFKALTKHEFKWISSGHVAILRTSPQARSLAKSEIGFPAAHLKLDLCAKN